ncbi:MAG: hypothetical protein AAB404_02915 [Patescibacteria group bacterium]
MAASKINDINKDYLNVIKERAKKTRVYKKFQFTGLTIAQLLNDEKHKSLYIRLAKKYDEQELMTLAKSVSGRKNVENKGAYFTKVFYKELNKKQTPTARP